jgi:type II secretory pathway component PulM
MKQWQRLTEWFGGLAPRERTMVGGALLFALATFLWIGVYEPVVEGRAKLVRSIESKKEELAEVRGLAGRVSALQTTFVAFDAKLRARSGAVSPLSEVESLTDAAGIRENVTAMSPTQKTPLDGYTEQVVAVRLKKMSYGRLMAFIKQMGASESGLRIKRMTVKPEYEDPTLLDVVLSIAAYEPS